MNGAAPHPVTPANAGVSSGKGVRFYGETPASAGVTDFSANDRAFYSSPIGRGASRIAARGEGERDTLAEITLILPPSSTAPSFSHREKE